MNTSQLESQGEYSVCLKNHSDPGQTRDLSIVLKPPEDKDCMESIASSSRIQVPTVSNAQNSNEYVIVESPVKGKRTTSKDKSNTCKISSQHIVSSPTSDQASTSSGRVLGPFWNLRCQELSPKLWLPTETDCVDLHSNWSSGSFNTIKSNSWFSIKHWKEKQQTDQNSQKICSQSMFSIAESIEKENTKKKRTNKVRKSTKDVPNKIRRFRLNPDPETASILRRWFGSVRSTYNWALGCIKAKPDKYKCTDYIWLRKRFVNKCNIPKDRKYLLDVPKEVRDTAIIDLAQAYKTNFKIRKNNPSHTFDIKFRSKKDNQSINIGSSAIKSLSGNALTMYPTYLLNKLKLYTRNNRDELNQIIYDCKLTMDRLNRFHLHVPQYSASASDNQTGNKHSWCAVDPGVRTLLTVYSPEYGVCFKLADGDIGRVYRLCVHLDNLISRYNTSENSKKKRKSMSKAIIRMRLRIRHIVDEVHWKCIRFILDRFQNVIIPPFEVSNMINRATRKIRTKTVRQMLSWRHYVLRTRLIAAAEQAGVNVYVRTEEYTTKTCTHCGALKQNVGGAKTYMCHHCHMVTDRDVNGSRNIFIKNASGGSEGPTLPSDFATLSLRSRTSPASKTRSKLKKESASNDEETLRLLGPRIHSS